MIAADISPEELQPLPSDETTVEPVPDFLPSDNEDDDEDRPDEVDDSTSAPYVPPHMPKFPSRHSFKQTPVSPVPKQHSLCSYSNRRLIRFFKIRFTLDGLKISKLLEN